MGEISTTHRVYINVPIVIDIAKTLAALFALVQIIRYFVGLQERQSCPNGFPSLTSHSLHQSHQSHSSPLPLTKFSVSQQYSISADDRQSSVLGRKILIQTAQSWVGGRTQPLSQISITLLLPKGRVRRGERLGQLFIAEYMGFGWAEILDLEIFITRALLAWILAGGLVVR